MPGKEGYCRYEVVRWVGWVRWLRGCGYGGQWVSGHGGATVAAVEGHARMVEKYQDEGRNLQIASL